MYKLQNWINSKYLDSKNIVNLLKKLNNDNYLVFEDFFKEDIIEKLVFDFINNEKIVIAEENYLNWVAYVKWCKIYWDFLINFKTFIESKFFLRYLSLFLWKKITFHFEEDLNLEQIEFIKNEKWLIIQCFEDKHYMNWHDDLWNDAIYLFYLNNDWEKEDGWLLELWNKEDNSIQKFDYVIPKMNTFVLLKPKKDFYHKVSKIKKWKKRYWIVKFLEFK